MSLSCAPFVSSPQEVVKRMLELAQVSDADIVCDLGCGDGRVLVTAVKDFGVKRAVGYEIREDLYKNTLHEVERQNLRHRIELVNGDLFSANLKEASVITLYLTSSANERLKSKIRNEARAGTRIVSHDFAMGDWRPTKKVNFNEHTIYLYVVPNAFSA